MNGEANHPEPLNPLALPPKGELERVAVIPHPRPRPRPQLLTCQTPAGLVVRGLPVHGERFCLWSTLRDQAYEQEAPPTNSLPSCFWSSMQSVVSGWTSDLQARPSPPTPDALLGVEDFIRSTVDRWKSTPEEVKEA